jgi:hypothetical protein
MQGHRDSVRIQRYSLHYIHHDGGPGVHLQHTYQHWNPIGSFFPGLMRNVAYVALGAGQNVGFMMGLVSGAPDLLIDSRIILLTVCRWNPDGNSRDMASDLHSSRSWFFLRCPWWLVLRKSSLRHYTRRALIGPGLS